MSADWIYLDRAAHYNDWTTCDWSHAMTALGTNTLVLSLSDKAWVSKVRLKGFEALMDECLPADAQYCMTEGADDLVIEDIVLEEPAPVRSEKVELQFIKLDERD